MSYLEQSATNAAESELSDSAPLTWSAATARARALRESVESLLEGTPIAPPLALSSLGSSLGSSLDSPSSSLVEAPLVDISPLPAPPTPPSHLGLPVLPVPPVPPVFASTDADLLDTAELETAFPNGDFPDTDDLLTEDAATAIDAPSETELAQLIAAHSMPHAVLPKPPELNEDPDISDAIDAPVDGVDAEGADVLAAELTELRATPSPEEVPQTPEAPSLFELSELPEIPETVTGPDLALSADIVEPSEITETSSFNGMPYAAETIEDEPFETEVFETEVFETEVFETEPEAALPPLPPPPAPPVAEELFALPPLPPPPPAPPAPAAPASLSETTLAVDHSDLSMFDTPAPAELATENLDLPLPPPPPPLFSDSDPQATAPIPAAWDTPIATPVPTENPVRSSLFSEEAPEPHDAFDSPFPTAVGPVESYSLQTAEPAPFPSVDEPQFDAGSWNTSTGDPSADTAAPTEGVSLFGLPTTAGNLFSEAPADALEEWPASTSGDWPTTGPETATIPTMSSEAADWPATVPVDADPLLTPVISPDSASAVGAFATPQDETVDNPAKEAKEKPARESFFKKILSRKEAPVETSPFLCESCDIPARVDIDNPSLGVRHLSCPKCAKMWTEPFEEDATAVH